MSTSQNIGIALAATIAAAEAVNVNGVQITSSPGPISHAIIAVVREDVAELVEIQYLEPTIFDHFCLKINYTFPPKKLLSDLIFFICSLVLSKYFE